MQKIPEVWGRITGSGEHRRRTEPDSRKPSKSGTGTRKARGLASPSAANGTLSGSKIPETGLLYRHPDNMKIDGRDYYGVIPCDPLDRRGEWPTERPEPRRGDSPYYKAPDVSPYDQPDWRGDWPTERPEPRRGDSPYYKAPDVSSYDPPDLRHRNSNSKIAVVEKPMKVKYLQDFDDAKTAEPTATKNIDPAKVGKSLYRPLDFDSFEIRLLKFHGGGRRATWSLEYASLINPPDYIALSYCWGNATKTKTIKLKNWGDVEVTVNLYNALKILRGMEDIGGPGNGVGKMLWVDALCINQQDSMERSQQVRQMRQIYSRAKEVISWIPCGSAQAVEYLVKNRFYGEGTETEDRVPSRKPTKGPPGKSDSDSVDASLQEHRNREEWVKQGWKIMEDFFSQAYWRRVWVIQEVSVATKVKVLCGNYEIPWDDVAAVIARWKKGPESVPLDTRAYLKAAHLAEFRDRFHVKREPISLLDAMRWSYQAEATDPRDKIFALLGLCHDGATYVPVPNYKQPLEEIIADISKTMMSFDRSLDLMCFKGTSLQEGGKLPSWTPNWVNLWSGSLHSMTLHETKYADWHTTFPFNPVLEGSKNRILNVDGRPYGKITRLTSKMAQIDSNGQITLTPETRAPWISSTSSLHREDPRPVDIRIRDFIWKTLTMGLLPPEISGSAAAFCFSQLWTPEGRGRVHNYALIEWIDRNARFEYIWTLREWSQMETISPPPLASTSSPVQMIDIFIETIEKVLESGMRLAVFGGIFEKAHRNLAMVPPSARENDRMWFISGCSVPILLRPRGLKEGDPNVQHQVIGGVYLSDAESYKFEAEEKWTRGEEDERLERGSMVLHLR